MYIDDHVVTPRQFDFPITVSIKTWKICKIEFNIHKLSISYLERVTILGYPFDLIVPCIAVSSPPHTVNVSINVNFIISRLYFLSIDKLIGHSYFLYQR